MTIISEETLTRYLTSRCSDSELADINQWISESPDNARLLFELERISALAEAASDDPRLTRLKEKALARINRRIVTDEIDADIERTAARRRSWLWSGAAAILIGIVAVTAFLTMRPDLPSVTIAAAESPVETTLPDGTKVWINKYSSLTYPEQFADNRQVTLKGEAYFEVARDTLHPFTVDGQYLDITVLGTKFTFRSSAGEAFSFVSLVEGSVKVNETNGEGCVVLKPGQKANYDPLNGLLTVNDTDTPLDAVWHDNNIPFRNASIRQIAQALEQLYGMKVHVNANVSSNATYSGAAMKYDSIDTTLNMLTNTLPIRYTITNGEVYISAR